jgi:hypothetical protein
VSVTITNFLVGLVLGVVARQLAVWWQQRRDAIKEQLLKAEDYFEHGILKDKWNIDLPDSWHNICVGIIDKAVAFVDAYASSKDFWLKFLKYTKNVDPSKITTDVAAALEKVRQNIENGLPDAIPAELKPLYEFKEQNALNISENKMEASAAMAPRASVVATPVPQKENIIAAIKATVAAKKVNEPQTPVTSDDLKRMIAASELRQKLLSGNK